MDYGLGYRFNRDFYIGTFIPNPADVGGLDGDIIGISWITFDSTSASRGTATPRIYVGVAEKNTQSIFVSTNGGTTCMHCPFKSTALEALASGEPN